jgi:hypothetical protein
MTVKHQASTPISNANATPVVPNTTGEGGVGVLREVTGSVTLTATQDVDSTVRFVRVPSTAKIKAIVGTSAAQTAGKLDIGVYYPTIGTTGKADLAANAIDQDFFASAWDIASAVQPVDLTNESGTYTIDKWNQPLWQAVGLTTDPGGFFDIVGTCATTAITTAAAVVGLSVRYVD